MTSVRENLFYELLYHERAKIFLKKFQEGLGAGIFMEALNLSFSEARESVSRLGHAADSYAKGIYDLEVKSNRYKKSYSCFIVQPDVIALKFRYILNTLSANYPGEYFKFCNAIASYIFDGRRPLQRIDNYSGSPAHINKSTEDHEPGKEQQVVIKNYADTE